MNIVQKDYNCTDWSEIFEYNPASKAFLTKKGSPTGHINTTKGKSYATVKYKGSNWYAARIIWILHNGYLDKNFVIDHIDGNSANNNISNLRVVTQQVNNRNARKRIDNSTGVCGVSFTTAYGSGKVQILHTYATASWHENGSNICKHFAVSKHGLLPAFAKACAYRGTKMRELEELGYGYTDGHGK